MDWLLSFGWEYIGELVIGVCLVRGLYLQMGNSRLIDFFRVLSYKAMVLLDEIRIRFFNIVESYILNPGYISQPALRMCFAPVFNSFIFLIPSLVWDNTLLTEDLILES